MRQRTPFSLSCRCLLLLTILLPLSILAAPRDMESKVKAAFIYHFTKFVEWPADRLPNDDSPLHICVLGESELLPLLQPLQERQVNGHPLAVMHVRDPRDISYCELLYIPQQTPAELQHTLDRAASDPILTISSMSDFVDHGGMIGFLVRDNRVRLEMNLTATRRAGLKINAQLIEVCERVLDSVAPTAQEEGSP